MLWSNHDNENTLRQVVELLIEKLGQCAVEADPGELETFREEMSAVSGALPPDLPPKNLLVIAGSAAEVLEKYNRQITKTIGKQNDSYKTIIRMFHDSLVKIAGTNAECVQSLDNMSEELKGDAAFKDLQSLHAHAGTRFGAVRRCSWHGSSPHWCRLGWGFTGERTPAFQPSSMLY
jgi:hypothetical protein